MNRAWRHTVTNIPIHDLANQMLTSTDQMGKVTRKEYDLRGDRTAVVDAMTESFARSVFRAVTLLWLNFVAAQLDPRA